MGSILFPGTATNVLTIANDVDIQLGTGDFTIEWFQYLTSTNLAPRPFSIGTYPTAMLAVSIEGGILYLWGASGILTSVSITNYRNVWDHFAVCRQTGVFNVYRNGARIVTVTASVNINNASTPLTIGNESSASLAASFGGNITNFHWVKGTALYSGTSHVVPTAPITPVANTKILLKATTLGTLLTDSSTVPKTVVNTLATWSAMTPFVAPVAPVVPVAPVPPYYRTVGMPPQFYPSAGDSLFSINRAAYLRTAGHLGQASVDYNALLNRKIKVFTSKDSSTYIQSRRIQSIGVSSTHVPLGSNYLTFKSPNVNTQRDALRRVRSSGSVAPKKKGANNSFMSG